MVKQAHIFFLFLKTNKNNSCFLKVVFYFTLFLKIISKKQTIVLEIFKNNFLFFFFKKKLFLNHMTQ